MTTARTLCCTLLALLAASCGPASEGQPEVAGDTTPPPAQEVRPPSPDFTAQLDSGSAAFRQDDFRGALAHYTRAKEIDPASAAAWFGVFMAHQALGNVEEANRALAEAQALDPAAAGAHPEISRQPR